MIAQVAGSQSVEGTPSEIIPGRVSLPLIMEWILTQPPPEIHFGWSLAMEKIIRFPFKTLL